ncbi:MAG TPA: dihydropteroate synthase [Candidatus Acidoferrum sp.]|nr:dihydropteroate synthase [Candidatus Acidoferrum sp.]
MRLRGRNFGWGERTYLMAIVNVTPDSFSGDGQTQIDGAIAYAVKQWNAGADMLDIGGESTRPGHEPVDEATELARVIPVIAGVRGRLRDAVISVDTTKPAVVRAAQAAGADIVNSVWGAPEDLLAAAAEFDMPVAVMHNQRGTHYDEDVVDAVVDFLRDCAQRAMLCGIGPERIMLDPGIGFGKTPNHNIRLLRSLERICALGFPTLLGTSRKSTIGKLTGREAHERIYGTAATTALGIAAGIDIVRVHDVAQNRDVISVSDAIVRDWRPTGWTG